MTDFDSDQHISMLVRPYALTGGRTRPQVDIAIESLIVTTPRAATGSRAHQAGSTDRHVLALCEQRPTSLAEIAALTRLPLGVARILVADMVTDGLVSVASRSNTNGHSADLLGRVLSGLRRL